MYTYIYSRSFIVVYLIAIRFIFDPLHMIMFDPLNSMKRK